jgi:hypothetical protein
MSSQLSYPKVHISPTWNDIFENCNSTTILANNRMQVPEKTSNMFTKRSN